MEAQEPIKIDGRTLSKNKVGKVGAKKKDSSDKAAAVIFYVKGHEVDSVGGLKKAREIARKSVESAAKKGKNK